LPTLGKPTIPHDTAMMNRAPFGRERIAPFGIPHHGVHCHEKKSQDCYRERRIGSYAADEG